MKSEDMRNAFKIILLGDVGVGKSNLLFSLLASPMYEFEPKHISTMDNDHHYHSLQVLVTSYCKQYNVCKIDIIVFLIVEGIENVYFFIQPCCI